MKEKINGARCITKTSRRHSSGSNELSVTTRELWRHPLTLFTLAKMVPRNEIRISLIELIWRAIL
jgi:hypothetical protein